MKPCEKRINSLYYRFFKDNDINPKTGRFLHAPIAWKFATFPFIGSRWGCDGFRKILFVGLDIGKDENPQKIISINDRRNIVENIEKFNPHVKGMVLAIQWLIKKNRGVIREARTYSAAIKYVNNPNDFLRHCCLTNFYKFVTENRKNRMGSENRSLILRGGAEKKLTSREIQILKPDIVVFEGRQFYTDKNLYKFMKEVKKFRCKVYYSKHPSFRGRTPKKYFNSFKKV